MSLQSTPTLLAIGALSVAGLLAHDGFDYFAKTENVVNGPLIYGVTILMHSVFGASGVTEKPKALTSVSENPLFKFFTLFLLAFAAVRDFEDTLLIVVLFLAITQLIRTKEERERHPTIL
jgi:protein-S-isoprenylcysteine O-methyltransferase Ste14